MHEAESFTNQHLFNWSRNSSRFVEPGSSSPHSQQPTTCPCLQLDQFSSCSDSTSLRCILIFFSHLHLDFHSGFFPSESPPPKHCMHPFLSPPESYLVRIILFLTCNSLVHAMSQPEGRWFESRWCHWNFSMT